MRANDISEFRSRVSPGREAQTSASLNMARAAGFRGWATQFAAKAMEANRIITPMSGVQRVTLSAGNILKWKYADIVQFLSAAQTGLQGESAKTVPAPVTAVPGVATVATLTVRAIAAVVRLSDTKQNGDFRPVPFAVSGSNVTAYTALLYPCDCASDFILWALSNNSGEANLVFPTDLAITIAADRVRPGALLAIEPINLRDL